MKKYWIVFNRKKIQFPLVFISQYYFKESKFIRLNATRLTNNNCKINYFIMKIPKKLTSTNNIRNFF